jgi:cyclic pyranopterin phosphate synthase
LKFKNIRLTGGEPLLYKDICLLIKSIKSQTGIEDIKLTTNGYLLEEMALRLKDAGLTHMNISLDAMNEEVFHKISRRKKLSKILRGIDKAIELGFSIKINSVIMKDVNDSEILSLFEYAKSKAISIRFLELMKMGHLYNQSDAGFYSQENILKCINKKYEFYQTERKAHATANEWITADGYIFGIIANESMPFCSDCDRLRLDNFGNIYGCLSSNLPIHLDINESDVSLNEKLLLALSHKQAVKFMGSDLSMLSIGG